MVLDDKKIDSFIYFLLFCNIIKSNIMVKNTFGGSKAKSFARKNLSIPASSFISPSSPFECIGCVHRLLGNGRCLVKIIHPSITDIQCVIRNKFKGRSKRNNLITIGSFVLVGLYDWEAPNFKGSDLLHVYSDEDISILRNSFNINSISVASFEISSSSFVDTNLIFSATETSTEPHTEISTETTITENAAIDFDLI
uniref:S1-like domain-containing protein n=1 Tax=viral metagenome TaxID=1070528 RepID=A0A6C0HUM8_9ZZZZ